MEREQLMGIPVFLSQVVAAATDTIQAGGGSVQTLDASRYYFFLSPKTAASDGQSLLVALKAKADASSGVAWTFVLDANLRLKVTHDAGGSTNLILNRGLAWNLGFAKVFATLYPVDTTLTITIPVPAGAGGYTAEFRSPWLWCPEMRVSDTGPSLFDPMVSPGIRTSAGSASRAPDMTAAYTTNGVQVEATFIFTAVEAMFRAREPDLSYGDVHEREAYETWWRLGPAEGRRFLFWRDKAGLVSGLNVGIATAGASAPPYVEYTPSEAMKAAPEIQPTAPNDLYWWNVTVRAWLTENGAGTHLGSG
jgi:hypothetical protein